MGHSEQVQDDYNRRAIEYIEALGSVEQMATPDRELISEWRDSCSGPLLDAGCGPGRNRFPWSRDGLAVGRRHGRVRRNRRLPTSGGRRS